MGLDSEKSLFDEQLSQLLLLFDKSNKEKIALQLINIFKLEKDGDYYTDQMERLLKRKLSPDEYFKVLVLNNTLNPHSGGGGTEEEE